MKIHDEDKLKELLSSESGLNFHAQNPTKNLIKCVACGKEVSTEAERCPHCGQPTESKKRADLSAANLTCGCIIVLIIGLIIWYNVILHWIDSLGLFNK
jgi:uncharacterized protein (DUF983 family)